VKLTATQPAAILSLHCNSGVGIRTPYLETGAKTPLPLVVFSFLPAVFVTGLFRAKSVMTGTIFWGDLRLTAPVRGSSNPINDPAAQRLEPVGGVLSETGNL
jgi:hypothetical protein